MMQRLALILKPKIQVKQETGMKSKYYSLNCLVNIIKLHVEINCET